MDLVGDQFEPVDFEFESFGFLLIFIFDGLFFQLIESAQLRCGFVVDLDVIQAVEVFVRSIWHAGGGRR